MHRPRFVETAQHENMKKPTSRKLNATPAAYPL